MTRLARSVIAQLYDRSGAARWGVPVDQFQVTLETSIGHAFTGRNPDAKDVDRYLASLHLEDLALAAACAAGQETAWDHFVLEYRPALYRAADAIDPTGGARDLADALYADLFGLKEHQGRRQSLFRYFHGRSSLATWLRAVLSQRHVDRLRAGRRFEPLPEDDSIPLSSTVSQKNSGGVPDPARAHFVEVMRSALSAAIAALEPRDRLRLACYYAQEMTLAAIGRMLREHEATVSRHLTRTRRAIREDVEERLRLEHGLDESSIAECFQTVVDDSGPLDMGELVGDRPGRKKVGEDRSR